MRTKILAVLLVATAWGCADAPQAPAELEQAADDSSTLVLEGQDIADQLDERLESAVYQAPGLFERLGLMWDAPSSGVLELRASLDGEAWTDWQKPTEVFAEAGSFAGHIDVPEGARTFQFRVLEDTGAPTWVHFAAIDVIPAPHEETIEVPEGGEPIGTVEQALGTSFQIQSRASWGARPPKCVSATVPNRATIHHTVTPTKDTISVPKRLRQIQAYHMYSQGWCDIGYNFLVSRDGRVWRGRGKNRLGAHVANNNSGNVGISFIGNYTSTKANQAQRCGTASLLRYLHQKNPAIKLRRTDIKGHRQYASTSCPGNALYNQLGGIVTLAREGGCD